MKLKFEYNADGIPRLVEFEGTEPQFKNIKNYLILSKGGHQNV